MLKVDRLRELLDYDWDQTTVLSGYCNFTAWKNWAQWRRSMGFGPKEYSSDVFGGNVKKIKAEAMDSMLRRYYKLSEAERERFEEHVCRHFYAIATWQQPYYRAAGSFLSETVPRLLKLAGGTTGIDSVRIVFFFDN